MISSHEMVRSKSWSEEAAIQGIGQFGSWRGEGVYDGPSSDEVEQVYSSRRVIKVYEAKPSHAPRPTETGPYVKDERSPE